MKKLISVLVLIVLLGGLFYFYEQMKNVGPDSTVPVACTMDAKLCPDGSSVGRVPPKCEFAACPNVSDPLTSGWETYKNNKYGYEIRYPNSWKISRGYYDASLDLATSIDLANQDTEKIPDSSGILHDPNLSITRMAKSLNKGQTAKDLITAEYNFPTGLPEWSQEIINDAKMYEFSDYGYTFADGSGGRTGPCGPSSGVKCVFAYVDDGENAFEIIFPDQPIFHKVLSTFKFTK